jgi:hypothetical protein
LTSKSGLHDECQYRYAITAISFKDFYLPRSGLLEQAVSDYAATQRG